MNLRAWFSDNYGGIKEGLEKHSFVAFILLKRDRVAGLRGAFGRRKSNFIKDRAQAHGTARGPRPRTWGKLQQALRAEELFKAAEFQKEPPPIFTR